jgi:hypothetical protein
MICSIMLQDRSVTCTTWVGAALNCIPPISRIARRAGFVALRQTFVGRRQNCLAEAGALTAAAGPVMVVAGPRRHTGTNNNAPFQVDF